MTGHGWPPGVRASPEVRAIFEQLPRHFVPFDRLFLDGGSLSITRLAEDVLGPPSGEVDDVTGGGWRSRMFREERAWPPSEGWLERKKLIFTAGGCRFIARFAGIGRDGGDKLARANALADVGVAIRPAALRYGFLFERWLTDARPLSSCRVPRPALLDAVRRLLSVSAVRRRPASDGAPPSELVQMASVNATECLGPEAGEAARRLEDVLPEVTRQARAAEVDGKMQAWEWLVLPDGRLLKADAVDHHAAHDLAGCQDVLWDVAGAQIELGLTEREAIRLAEATRRLAPGADPSLLPFYRVCLVALEVGRWAFAAANEPPGAERARRDRMFARYRTALGRELAKLPQRASRRYGPGVDAVTPYAPDAM
jgi:hypothetical protein